MQGDGWHLVAELHKLELILNSLTFGYSVLFVESNTAVFRNPMPHLLSLTVGHPRAVLRTCCCLPVQQLHMQGSEEAMQSVSTFMMS
jgi:hypothetical protein